MNGNEVRSLRMQLGLSPQHLASLLGVHLTTVYRWEGAGAQELRLDPMQHSLLLHLQRRIQQQSPKDFGQQLLKGLLVGGALVGLACLLADLVDPNTKRRS